MIFSFTKMKMTTEDLITALSDMDMTELNQLAGCDPEMIETKADEFASYLGLE